MKTVVAVTQMTSQKNKAENFDAVVERTRVAKSFGAQLVCFPENFAFLGSDEQDAKSAAEPLDGQTVTRLRALAKELKVWLSLGGFQEKISGNDKYANTHLVMDDHGELVATYRKMHLFSVELFDGTIYNEAKSVIPGDEPVCVKAPFFTAGLSICYDLRFPEYYARLRKLGAQVLLVPAAFTSETGKAHWEVLLRARAIETQCYVVAAAQTGKHNEQRVTHGHAMIVDPWGTVLAQCGESCHVAVAEINLDHLERVRRLMPIERHRRNYE